MILINERPCQSLPGESSLFVAGEYNQDVIDLMHSLDLAVWQKATKEWEVPVTSLSKLIQDLPYIDEVKLHIQNEDREVVKSSLSLSYKTQPYPYQLEGIQYGLEHDRWLLLDDMGLGKTLMTLYLAEELKAQRGIQHCLIICGINALKSNWKKEVAKHTDDTCIVLGERVNSKGRVSYATIDERAKQLKDPIEEFFVIANVETFRSPKVIEAYRKSKNKFDLIIVDECHKIKSKTSQQGANILKLDAPYKVAATGTLIMNNPLDAYVPLTWIGANCSNLTNFKKYYCTMGGFNGTQVIGFKHMDVLKDQLSQCSLRRTKDLLELPPKNIIHELLDMNDDHRKFYDRIKDGIKDEVDKVELNTNSLLALATRLRQASVCPSILSTENISSTKIDRAVELAEQIVENGDKVVLFSNFKEPVSLLAERLQQYNPVIGTGDISDADFSDNIDRFQTDPTCKVFIGTISKMGTGITLTAASYAIFIDCAWTAAVNTQCEDRIYRIGTSKPVFIYYLWNAGTSDEHIKELVEAKAQVSDYIVDNKIADNLTDVLRKMLIE